MSNTTYIIDITHYINNELHNQAVRFTKITNACLADLNCILAKEYGYDADITEEALHLIDRIELLQRNALFAILACTDTSADDACAYCAQAAALVWTIKGLYKDGYFNWYMTTIVHAAINNATGAFEQN